MIIRANLGYRLFFAFCMLSGLFLPVICIIELVRKFNLLVFTDFIALIFGLGMGLWLFLYCFKFVFGCSIILNEKSIILKIQLFVKTDSIRGCHTESSGA